MASSLRVGIDVRYLSHGLLGGVHTYVANLVPALVRAAPADEFILYADAKAPFELNDLPANAQVRLLPYRTPLSSVAIDLRLRSHMAADGIDVAHFPANYGFGPRDARTVITLHDEINILPLREILRGHRKALRTMAMMTYLHGMTRAAVRRADCVLTVSEYARRRICEVGALPGDRVVAVHSAAPQGTGRVEDVARLDAIRSRFGLPQRFILADALKNPETLLRAWRRLDPELRSATQVLFFSRTPDIAIPVRTSVERGEARVLVRPARDDLLGLYSLCDAFVFPSWIEGFGLPVLEAMACGAPVIASNRGALPEIAGGAGLLCEADDDAALATHLATIMTRPEEALRLRRLGLARAARFSWERTASAVIEVYRARPLGELEPMKVFS